MNNDLIIPSGWIVWNLSQEPIFHLWNCCLIQNPVPDDKIRLSVEVLEADSMNDALREAIKLVKKLENA